MREWLEYLLLMFATLTTLAITVIVIVLTVGYNERETIALKHKQKLEIMYYNRSKPDPYK